MLKLNLSNLYKSNIYPNINLYLGISMDQLPLRIPPDLIDHVKEHRRSLIRTRRRADKELHVDFNDSSTSTNGTVNPSQQLQRYCGMKNYILVASPSYYYTLTYLRQLKNEY